MKRLVARLGLALFALCSPILAQAACPIVVDTLDVTSAQIAPELNSNVSAAEITGVAELTRPGFADGITDIRFGYKVGVEPGPYRNGCQTWKIQSRILTTMATVYVAREVKEDSCRWDALLDHELKHVQIAQRAMDFGAAILRERLTNAMEYQVLEPGDLETWVTNMTRQALELATDRYEQGNQALDVPAESHRLADMCEPTKLIVGPRRSRR